MRSRYFIIGALLAALLQTLALAKIIYDRATLLQSSQEVTLETRFIDPRDLFRGHYATLDFPISQVNPEKVVLPAHINDGDVLYIEMTSTTGGFSVIKSVTGSYPANPQGPVLKVLAGASYDQSRDADRTFRLDIPFDRFYAPKIRAKKLERLERERKLGVILAIDGKGNAAIKGITIEGRKIYEEPLY